MGGGARRRPAAWRHPAWTLRGLQKRRFRIGGRQRFYRGAASATGGGNIEIRLDALDGPKVGTLHVEGTGGWNNYIDAVTLLKDDQGKSKHDYRKT
ncbi:carbohydrate-binding protein [Paenibacillus sp. JTLBN-2024]